VLRSTRRPRPIRVTRRSTVFCKALMSKARIDFVSVLRESCSKISEPLECDFWAEVAIDRWVARVASKQPCSLLVGSRPKIARLPVLEKSFIFNLGNRRAARLAEKRQALVEARTRLDSCEWAAESNASLLAELCVPLAIRNLSHVIGTGL